MSEPTRKIKASLGMRYLPPVCEFIKNMRSRQVSHQIAPEIEIKEVAAFNEEINLIWERLGTNFAILVRRDAAYLNWKFVQQPHMEHQRFIAWQQGIPVGYVIIRHAQPPENNTGIICDLFADPKDEKLIRSLVAHAVDMFQMQQVDCVIVATGIPSFQALLENLGFKETRRIRPMIRADIEIPRTDSFFGKGDHDWDQYPLTNTKFNS